MKVNIEVKNKLLNKYLFHDLHKKNSFLLPCNLYRIFTPFVPLKMLKSLMQLTLLFLPIECFHLSIVLPRIPLLCYLVYTRRESPESILRAGTVGQNKGAHYYSN